MTTRLPTLAATLCGLHAALGAGLEAHEVVALNAAAGAQQVPVGVCGWVCGCVWVGVGVCV